MYFCFKHLPLPLVFVQWPFECIVKTRLTGKENTLVYKAAEFHNLHWQLLRKEVKSYVLRECV